MIGTSTRERELRAGWMDGDAATRVNVPFGSPTLRTRISLSFPSLAYLALFARCKLTLNFYQNNNENLFLFGIFMS